MAEQQPSLKDGIDDTLDEVLTLILGTQVLLGFGYRSVFEPSFASLGPAQNWAAMAGLIVLLLGLSILLLPISWHLLIEHGLDRSYQYRLTTTCMALTLPLLALAIGIDLEVASVRTVGLAFALVGGIVIAVLALGLWFGARLKRSSSMPNDNREAVPLKDKIKQVLTETRVVLPGAQTLLGFAAITTLANSFESLPAFGRYMHVFGLAAVAVSMLLLMTPAAIHRISEHGHASQWFLKTAGKFVLAGLAALAVSLAAEMCVVFLKVTDSTPVAIGAGLASLLVMLGMWFLLPQLLRPR